MGKSRFTEQQIANIPARQRPASPSRPASGINTEKSFYRWKKK
jgi:hypothetical protein